MLRTAELRLSGSADNTLKLWDLASGKEMRTFTGHSESVICVAIAPNGRTALSGSFDNTLKLWDLASGRELRTFIGHSKRVESVAIAPDGRANLALGELGQDAQALGLGQWERAAHLHRPLRYGGERRHRPGQPNSGSQGAATQLLRLWDLASGKRPRAFIGHSDWVASVAIFPRRPDRGFSGSEDKTLKLWDLASGKELRTFTGHSGCVRSAAIAPDGRTALSGSR